MNPNLYILQLQISKIFEFLDTGHTRSDFPLMARICQWEGDLWSVSERLLVCSAPLV
jgi:hypothetical protein